MSKKFVSNLGKLCGIESSKLYRALLRTVLYVSIVRLDVQVAVPKLSRFASCPNAECVDTMIRLCEYLLETSELCLLFAKETIIKAQCCCTQMRTGLVTL
jgi:hypothetical protein